MKPHLAATGLLGAFTQELGEFTHSFPIAGAWALEIAVSELHSETAGVLRRNEGGVMSQQRARQRFLRIGATLLGLWGLGVLVASADTVTLNPVKDNTPIQSKITTLLTVYCA